MDFDRRTVVQLIRAGDGTSGTVLTNPVGVDGVERWPFFYVGDIDADRDQARPVGLSRDQTLIEVLEDLACLNFERLVAQSSAVLVYRQLSGDMGKPSVDDDVGVVAQRLEQLRAIA